MLYHLESLNVQVTAACWGTTISYDEPVKTVHEAGTSALFVTIPILLEDSVSSGSGYCGSMTIEHVSLTSIDHTSPDPIANFDGTNIYTI